MSQFNVVLYAFTEVPECLVLRICAKLDAEHRCQCHPNRTCVVRLAGNNSSIQHTIEEKVCEDVRRHGLRDLRVPDHVRRETDGGVYHIGVCGGIEDPRDAPCVRLVGLPVDRDVLEDSSGWPSNNGDREAFSCLSHIWTTTEAPQCPENSGTKVFEKSSEVFDGRERCDKRSQCASECGITVSYIPEKGPSDDGRRCLVRAVVVNYRGESEKNVRSDSESGEGKDNSGDDAVDRPQVQR